MVREGDTLRAIAEKFGVPLEVLVWSNDLDVPDLLKVGQHMLIPAVPGLIHQVRAGDTVASLAKIYAADTGSVIDGNSLVLPYVIRVDQKLLIPGGVPPRPLVVTAPAKTTQPSPETVGLDERPQPTQHQLAAAAVDIRPLPAQEPPPRTPQEAFVASIAQAARESQRASGVPASVTIAQASLETYWGSSRLARDAKNYFGIKAKEKPGSAGVVWLDVWEVIGGTNVHRREPFRAYASVADSFTDHGRFFLENPRYARAVAAKDDARRFAQEIHRAGYATDPAYSNKLIALMDRYNLFRFDQ